jgi:transposase
VTSQFESLPSDLAAAHAQILAERAARVEAEARLVEARAEAANAQADLSSTEALISRLKLEMKSCAASFTALAQNRRRASWT